MVRDGVLYDMDVYRLSGRTLFQRPSDSTHSPSNDLSVAVDTQVARHIFIACRDY